MKTTKIIICLLICISTLSFELNSFAASSGCNYNSYNSHKLYSGSNCFYSVHTANNTVTAVKYGTDGSFISSQSFEPTKSIKNCVYVNGNFYTVCYGDADNGSNKRWVYLYFSPDFNNIDLRTATIAKYDDILYSAIDACGNLFYVGTYDQTILNILKNDGSFSTVDLYENITGLVQSPNGQAVIFSAGTHLYYYKNGSASNFTKINIGINIDTLSSLSDCYVLCNNSAVYDLFGNNICSIDCNKDCAAASCDGKFFYSCKGHSIRKYNISGDYNSSTTYDGHPISCCESNGVIAALVNEGNNVSLKIISEKDFSGNTNSVSKAFSSYGESSDSSNGNNGSIKNLNEIFYITQGTTLAKFKKMLNSNGSVLQCINYKGKTITSGKLGTSACVTVKQNNIKTVYTIILTGDITGEGNINNNDINNLIDVLTGKEKLSGICTYAADINGDGIVDLLDLLLMQRVTEGVYTPEN